VAAAVHVRALQALPTVLFSRDGVPLTYGASGGKGRNVVVSCVLNGRKLNFTPPWLQCLCQQNAGLSQGMVVAWSGCVGGMPCPGGTASRPRSPPTLPPVVFPSIADVV